MENKESETATIQSLCRWAVVVSIHENKEPSLSCYNYERRSKIADLAIDAIAPVSARTSPYFHLLVDLTWR